MLCLLYLLTWLQLSNVINSKKATEISIKVIDVFVHMRSQIRDSIYFKKEVEAIKNNILNNSKNIELVFTYLDELLDKKEQPRKKIGYKK